MIPPTGPKSPVTSLLKHPGWVHTRTDVGLNAKLRNYQVRGKGGKVTAQSGWAQGLTATGHRSER